jgi:hypothetical protein
MSLKHCENCAQKIECLSSPVCLILLQELYGVIVSHTFINRVVQGKAFSSDRNYCTCKSYGKIFNYNLLEVGWARSSLRSNEIPLNYQHFKATCLIVKCKSCGREFTLTYNICPKLGGIFKWFKKKKANCDYMRCDQRKRIPESHILHAFHILEIPFQVLIKINAL